mgnify:FL=1
MKLKKSYPHLHLTKILYWVRKLWLIFCLITDPLLCAALWEERRILYEQCMDLQLFYRDTEQADTWMAKQEAFLANEDLGDSLDSVEALIKKHEDFEKSLAAQEEKIKALDEFATKLIDGEHYAADDVAQRRAMVLLFFINFLS